MTEPHQRTAWEKQLLVREKNRPTIHDYLPRIFEEFFELHGDRSYGDDGAILGGIGRLNGIPVTILAEVKGRNLEENKQSNFAMPHPEGYRKTLRLAKQAEKFHRPIICFIDTPGAFCGIEAEERGQGEAIAKNLAEFMSLKTPVVSVVLGEGGSGGALALAVADQVWMLENAIYSVISPEGCASILWKDAKKMQEAARYLKLTARDLLALGVVEQVIAEGSPKDFSSVYNTVKAMLYQQFTQALKKPTEMLLAERYQRFRRIGSFRETD